MQPLVSPDSALTSMAIAVSAAAARLGAAPMHGLEPNKGLSTPKKRLSLLLSTKGTVAHGGAVARRDGLQ